MTKGHAKKALWFLLLCSLPSFAAPSWLHTNSGTSTPLTAISTTAGNVVVAMVSSSGATPTLTLGSQAMTQIGACVQHVFSAGTLYDCAFWVKATGGQTSITCGGVCTSVNFMAYGEASGAGTPYIDNIEECTNYGTTQCQTNGAATSNVIVGIPYNPGYSSEALMFIASASATCTAPSFTNLTSTSSAIPNGNSVGWGISSGTSQATMLPVPACGSTDGLAIGVVGAGATQQLTSNQAFQSQETPVTTGSATVTVHVANTGDLFLALPWCITTCTTGTLTLGSQALTCPASAQGVSSSVNGQGFICYVITNTSGALTLTFTPGGSPTQWQVLGFDEPLSANTAIAFDTAAFAHCESGCSEGTTVTTPSLTASGTGELFFNYVFSEFHVTAFGGSWACYLYGQTSTDTNTCYTATTENGVAWITNAASATEAPNATVITSDSPFGSIVAAFKYATTSGPCLLGILGVGRC
jgi:hypothetical protein